MTITVPWRRMTLQLSQRALTEALTFNGSSTRVLRAGGPARCGYFRRYVIRPRVRSYGDSSTRTRSPGRIRMKFIRSLPLMWARTRWPFSSSTANIVLGNGSMTVPSTSIASRLATGAQRSLSHDECRSGRTDTRTRSVSNELVGVKGVRSTSRDLREDLRTVVRDRDRVLEVGGQRSVAGHDRPAIRLHDDLVAAEREHRLDRQADAGRELHPADPRAVVRDLRSLVHLGADPVADELTHDPVAAR